MTTVPGMHPPGLAPPRRRRGRWVRCHARRGDRTFEPAAQPVEIGVGPQLFLDDHLIDRLEGLERRAEPPERLEGPVLDSKTFGCTQPYVTVTRDRERLLPPLVQPRPGRLARRVRGRPALGEPAGRLGPTPGLRGEPRRRRRPRARDPGVATSSPTGRPPGPRGPAGRRRRHVRRLLAGRLPLDRPRQEPRPADLARGLRQADPARRRRHRRRLLRPVEQALRRGREGACGARRRLCARPRAGKGIRRLVGLSTSPDFLRWERPRRIFGPDERDEGLLEFYGMGAVHLRGSLRHRPGAASSATTCPATPAARGTASAIRCSRPAGMV